MTWKCLALFGMMLIFPLGLYMISAELKKYRNSFQIPAWQVMIDILSFFFRWIALPGSGIIIIYILFKCWQAY